MSLDILNVAARSMMESCIAELGENTAWEIFDSVVATEGKSRTQLVEKLSDDQLVIFLAGEWLTHLESNDIATSDAISAVHEAQEAALPEEQ